MNYLSLYILNIGYNDVGKLLFEQFFSIYLSKTRNTTSFSC